MIDPTHELKTRAEILHRRIQSGDRSAVQRLRALPEFRRASDGDLAAADIHRTHCLAVIAAELGFANWPQAKSALTADGPVADFGTLLYPKRAGGHINRWYKRYEEAAEVRNACDGYLLAYRTHYLVVDRFYIESLGLDPADPDWEALGFDWVRPKDPAVRARLYGKLLVTLPLEAA
jgi:hypothetical protein